MYVDLKLRELFINDVLKDWSLEALLEAQNNYKIIFGVTQHIYVRLSVDSFH